MTAPDTLYRYAPLIELDDLLEEKVAFVPLSVLDDPAEVLPWNGDVYANPPLARIEEEMDRFATLMAERHPAAAPFKGPLKGRLDDRERREVSAFLAETADLLLGSVERSLLFLSASTEAGSPLLWRRQAAGHRGFVVAFDPSHPDLQAAIKPAIPWFPVTYQEERPPFLGCGINGPDFDPHLAALFAFASGHWREEKEWRLAVHHSGGEGIVRLPLPAQAIRGLMFGARVGPDALAEAQARVRRMPEFAHVRLFQARPAADRMAMTYHPLDQDHRLARLPLQKPPMTAPSLPGPPAGKPLSIVLMSDRGFRYGAGMGVYRQAQGFLCAGHAVSLIASNLDNDWHRTTDFGLDRFPGTWRGIAALSTLPPLDQQPNHVEFCDRVFDDLARTLRGVAADVLLVGNLHGANWPLAWLERLRAVVPKVVVFLADLHLITGRCAYSGDCGRFLTGCDEDCPTSGQYPALPPSLIREAWDMRSRLFDRPDGIPLAAASDWFATIARQRFPSAGMIRTVHYGLDELVYAPMSKPLARRLLGLEAGATVITTGAVDVSEPRKGGDLLLPLIEALGRRPGVQVAVFGLTGALGNRLAALPHVRQVGLIPSQDMPVLLSASDLFVGLSREEGLGQTFIEAAACGVPSVAFDVGGIGEAVSHGQTGLLSPEVSLDGLLACIGTLIDDPVRRHTFARRARALVSSHFTQADQASRWTKFLADL